MHIYARRYRGHFAGTDTLASRRLGFEVPPKDAAPARQARLLRELGGSPYAPPQAEVPARVADLPAMHCTAGGEQVSRRHPERVGQPLDRPQADVALAALSRADVGAVQAGAVGQFVLREAGRRTEA